MKDVVIIITVSALVHFVIVMNVKHTGKLVQYWMKKNMKCKRGHGDWFMMNFVTKTGKIKKGCSYIMGYKMVGDQGTNVIQCCDLKKGEKLPKTYLPLTENKI